MAEQPTPCQALAVALNPWSWAYVLMMTQLWAGGKLCDLIWPPVREARER
jgi:hypothetical protein